MGIFSRKATAPAARAQLRTRDFSCFGALESQAFLGGEEVRLYRAVRAAVPVVDAAITKLIRLTGGLSAVCEDERASERLNDFLRRVDVGRGQRGIGAFMDSYLDSLLVTGRAIGEIVTRDNREILAVLCGDVCDVQIKEGESPLDFVICGDRGSGTVRPLPYQELLLFTPLKPEAGQPYGVSIMRGMPFLADVLLKIYDCIGVNWERAGNLRYSVIYRPNGDGLDRAYAKERAEQIATEWSAAMSSGKNGAVRDFVAVGDVDISVIGADGRILDSETPVRQMLEQLISKTGIPPFMLGLSWSSTERMSAQQADLMTSEITALRRALTPAAEKICELWLRMHGYNTRFEIKWDDINLQDYVEEARADLFRAQTRQLEGNPSPALRGAVLQGKTPPPATPGTPLRGEN